MGSVNNGIRFLLELAVLAALGYRGFRSQSGALQWLIGLGAPALAALVWAVFVNPQGPWASDDPLRLLLELASFGAGVAALIAVERNRLAVGLRVRRCRTSRVDVRAGSALVRPQALGATGVRARPRG